MKSVALVVLAGCWADRPAAEPIAVLAAPARTQDRVEAAHRPTNQLKQFPRHTAWTGLYQCSQGLTAVRLEIDVEGLAATAVFEFSAHPSNPMVPSGASRLKGVLAETIDGTYQLDVDPFEWVSQPPGYFMVGVTATTDTALREMHGTMKAPTCGRIDLTRER